MFYGPCVVLTDVTSFLVCENNYRGHVSQKYDGDDAYPFCQQKGLRQFSCLHIRWSTQLIHMMQFERCMGQLASLPSIVMLMHSNVYVEFNGFR